MRIAVTGSIATDHLMTFPGASATSSSPSSSTGCRCPSSSTTCRSGAAACAANICLRHGLPGADARSSSARSAPTSPTTAPGWSATASTATRCTSPSCTTPPASCAPPTRTTTRSPRSTPARWPRRGEIELRPDRRAGGRPRPGADRPERPRRDAAAHRRVPPARHPVRRRPLPAARPHGGRADPPASSTAPPTCSRNDYEKGLIEQKTGWSDEEVLDRVGVRVTTLGPKGAGIDRKGEPSHARRRPPPSAARPTRPASATRSARASWPVWPGACRWSGARQIGNLTATHVLERVGGQEYELGQKAFLERFTAGLRRGGRRRGRRARPLPPPVTHATVDRHATPPRRTTVRCGA